MSQVFLSVAIWQPLAGMEAASVATMHELGSIVANKGYGRDLMYKSPDSNYVLLRYWARLGNEIEILKVYEKLEEIGA